MKKLYYVVAVATFALLSCQQDQDPVVNNETKSESFIFKASVEGLGTRADMDAFYGLVWASGDKIGIFFPTWGEKNQSFTISNGVGKAHGEFIRDQSGDYSISDASSAYFPRVLNNSESDVYNYVLDNGEVKFNLLKGYYNYTSGQMLTPLIASLSGSKSTVNFYHAGAAVKVTINNLPGHTKSIGMTVDGKQIVGDFSINPANAGTTKLVAGSGSSDNNTVWLNFTNNSESAWTFIFPVPTLTSSSTLSFQIYDVNNVRVWSGNASNQPFLDRADVLVMDPLTITPYSKFKTKSGWRVHCTLDGTNWVDREMVTDGETSIAKGLDFTSAGQFKVTDGSNWYPNNNYEVNTAGTYDVIFNNSDHSINIVSTSDFSYPNVPVE